MNLFRLFALIPLSAFLSAPAPAQLQLPDALQGNPLEDKMIGETPDNPFAPIHSFSMEGVIQDGVTGIAATTSEHPVGVDGYVGRAVHFDGTSSAEVPIDLHPLGLPNLTIALMVNADPIPADPDELATVPTSGYVWSDGDSFIILNNQKKTSAFLSAYTAKAGVHDSTLFQVPHGQWHMVAMSRSLEPRINKDKTVTCHTVLRFYVNGRYAEDVAEVAASCDAEVLNAALNAEPPSFTLGSLRQQTTKLRGAIDSIAIYDRALTKEELDELRGFWRQAAGNEYFFSRSSAPRPIEASREFEVRPDSTSLTASANPATTGDRRAATADVSAEGDGTATYGGPLEVAIDATSVTPVNDGNDGMSAGETILGSDGSRMQEPPDRFGQPPSIESTARQIADDEARRAAIRDSAISRSPLANRISQPGVDAGSMNQDTDFDAPAIITDQRADATPAAGAGAVGSSDQVFDAPVQRADNARETIASEQGQALIQSADWRIEGMVPGSADKSPIYPGDEVTVKIRVSKDDPANKIPSVRLVTRVGPGLPSPTYDLTINTAEAKPTDEREIPITLTVPASLEFADDAAQAYWRPRVWLNSSDGLPLRDGNTGNHSIELALSVSMSASGGACDESRTAGDGSRVTKDCLLNTFGKLRDPEPAPSHEVKHVVSLADRTETPISGRYVEDNTDVMTFAQRGSVLGFLKIGERGDRPCRLVIDDAWVNDVEPGQVVDKCGGAAGDYKEIRIPEDYAISGIAVCDSIWGSPRVKGVKVETRPILENGSLSEEVRYRETAQQNCNAWAEMVRCPSGQVAGGIRASFFRGPVAWAPREALSGIGLVCGRIESHGAG